MDFSPTPRTAELAPSFTALIEEDLPPLERDLLAAGEGAAEEGARILAAARAKGVARGLLAPHLPREWGGLGLSLLEFAPLAEILGRSLLGHYACNVQAPDAGNMELLLHHGSPAQRERWLAPLARGEIRSCFGMTEPDRPGSNPTWLDTRAVRDGEEYVLSGRKWFTSSADGAAFCIVMAVTRPDAPKAHARASQLIVPTDAPGFVLVRNLPVMGAAGGGWMSHAEVRFDEVRVPADNLVGADGAGFALAQERLGPGRIHHAMRWLGIAGRAFDLMVERAAGREIAPGESLGTKGVIGEWIAESRAEIDAARLLVLHAAWRIDRDGAAAARDEIALLKFHVAAVLQRTLDRAIQVHGALGLTDLTPLAFWWRHERGARIYDGADEVHKAAVARRILSGARVKPGAE